MLAGARGTHAATRHVIDAGKEQGDREAASVVTRAAHVQQQSPSWYGAAQHGAAQRGAARRGAAWRGSDWWTHRSAVADRIEDAKAKGAMALGEGRGPGLTNFRARQMHAIEGAVTPRGTI